MGALLGFLPRVIGKGAAFVAQYAQKSPGETNVLGYLSLAAGAYFGADKDVVVGILQSLIEAIQ